MGESIVNPHASELLVEDPKQFYALVAFISAVDDSWPPPGYLVESLSMIL
jgi:hypothetical protein